MAIHIPNMGMLARTWSYESRKVPGLRTPGAGASSEWPTSDLTWGWRGPMAYTTPFLWWLWTCIHGVFFCIMVFVGYEYYSFWCVRDHTYIQLWYIDVGGRDMVIWLYDAICFFDFIWGNSSLWQNIVIMPKTEISTSMSAWFTEPCSRAQDWRTPAISTWSDIAGPKQRKHRWAGRELWGINLN